MLIIGNTLLNMFYLDVTDSSSEQQFENMLEKFLKYPVNIRLQPRKWQALFFLIQKLQTFLLAPIVIIIIIKTKQGDVDGRDL